MICYSISSQHSVRKGANISLWECTYTIAPCLLNKPHFKKVCTISCYWSILFDIYGIITYLQIAFLI